MFAIFDSKTMDTYEFRSSPTILPYTAPVSKAGTKRPVYFLFQTRSKTSVNGITKSRRKSHNYRLHARSLYLFLEIFFLKKRKKENRTDIPDGINVPYVQHDVKNSRMNPTTRLPKEKKPSK